MEASVEKEQVMSEGSMALTIVLGLMLQLGRTKTLTPDQLDTALAPITGLLAHSPQRKALRDRIRSYQREWSPPRS